MSEVKFELSKKAKWLMIIGLPCALIISIWIGTSDDVDRLVHLAKKGDYQTRLQAIAELGSYGRSAADATDALHSLLLSNDSDIRRAAGRALIQIDHRVAVEAFTDALSSGNGAVRMDAREGLEAIGTQRAQAVVSKVTAHSEKRYQRSRINSGWFKEMKDNFKREKEEKYRRHRKLYGDKTY